VVIILLLSGCSSYNSALVGERRKISAGQQIYKLETATVEFVEFTRDPPGYAVWD